jgi:hypothetical protein
MVQTDVFPAAGFAQVVVLSVISSPSVLSALPAAMSDRTVTVWAAKSAEASRATRVDAVEVDTAVVLALGSVPATSAVARSMALVVDPEPTNKEHWSVLDTWASVSPVPTDAAGNVPVTSAARSTALNVGAPAALPCSRVVVVPREARTEVAWEPAPKTIRLAVNAAAFVVQVAQAMVPVVVMAPPVIGDVVAMFVTVPVPPVVVQLPESTTTTPKLFVCRQRSAVSPVMFGVIKVGEVPKTASPDPVSSVRVASNVDDPNVPTSLAMFTHVVQVRSVAGPGADVPTVAHWCVAGLQERIAPVP